MIRGTLVIFAKQPVAGRVKTRLGRDIGMPAAAWWFRHQTSRLIRRVAREPHWDTVLAVAPDTAVRSRAWPGDLRRWPQGRGDLGVRMDRALRAFGPGPAMIIGADIPGIAPRDIAAGFRLLGNHDAVFGPAQDGGYWLIGLKRPIQAPRSLFMGVRWSTETALSDTVATLGGMSTAYLRTLCDVDTAADLRPRSDL